MTVLRSLVVLVALPILASPRGAAPRVQNAPAKPPQNSAPDRPAQGFKAEFVANLDEVQAKIMELAASVPADRYGWRPAPDVRSVSEVYMHIAGSNYFLATFLGVTPPKMNGDIEKNVTRKADVLAELRKSFEHLRAAAAGVSDLDKPVKMLGASTTYRGVLMTMLSHLHEHLGQSIAYARMNGVVPPWSR
jgi:uncharacterized damage-inducible protein DinB